MDYRSKPAKNPTADRMDMFEIETNVRKLILELVQPLLDKIQVEKQNLMSEVGIWGINTNKVIHTHAHRLESLEAALFEEKANDQFSEIRKKL